MTRSAVLFQPAQTRSGRSSCRWVSSGWLSISGPPSHINQRYYNGGMSVCGIHISSLPSPLPTMARCSPFSRLDTGRFWFFWCGEPPWVR
jgi:hypothetical protein